MLKKRLENIENYEIPKEEFAFPAIPDGSIAAYTFSLSDGVRWRVSSPVVRDSNVGYMYMELIYLDFYNLVILQLFTNLLPFCTSDLIIRMHCV